MLTAPAQDQLAILGPVLIEIEEGIASFLKFTNDALQAYYQRRIADGASWEQVAEPPDVLTPPGPGEVQ
jgi:hypothetical protein